MSSPFLWLREALCWCWEVAGEIIAPSFCCHCLSLGPWLCHRCWSYVQFYEEPIALSISSPALTRVWAVTKYQVPVTKLMHVMKYQHGMPIARWCGRMMFEKFWRSHPLDINVITAVPLHPHREAERGFNQAAVMAQTLAELVGIPYQSLLIRQKSTKYQASTHSKEERLENLRGVFAVRPGVQVPAKILIVDDVATTGSTLISCVEILQTAGAKAVIALTFAHGENSKEMETTFAERR